MAKRKEIPGVATPPGKAQGSEEPGELEGCKWFPVEEVQCPAVSEEGLVPGPPTESDIPGVKWLSIGIILCSSPCITGIPDLV
jgi:hypothetical protein